MTAFLETFSDYLAVALMLLGAALSLAAAIGLVRFPDTLARLHTAAKPQVLGLLLILLGVALRLRSPADVATLTLVAAFQLATAPVATHLLGRAAIRYVDRSSDRLVVDEIAEPSTHEYDETAGSTVSGDTTDVTVTDPAWQGNSDDGADQRAED